MIVYKQGNMFDSNADVLVNAVNCVGVMGAGLALQFKNKYPEMFVKYKRVCNSRMLKPGYLDVYKAPDRVIINLPTKRHWKDKSNLKDVEEGIIKLGLWLDKYPGHTVAIPKIGCGLGGLD